MGYKLRTERIRIVHKNERGRVTKRKSFNRGDVITKDDFQEKSRFDQLVESGALVDEDQFEGRTFVGFENEVQGRGVGNSKAETLTTLDKIPEQVAVTKESFEGAMREVAERVEAGESIDDILGEVAADAEDSGGDSEPDGDGEGSGEGSSGSDKYDEMSYPDLQQEAKSRTGDGSGNAEALKARLREQDVIDADDDE